MSKNRFGVIDKPIRTINWQKVVSDEIGNGSSANAVRTYFKYMKMVASYCGVDIPTVKFGRINIEKEWLDSEQISVLLNAIKGHKYEPLILFGLHGLRIGEAIAITPKDIHDGYIHVSKTAVYSKKQEIIKTPKTATSIRQVPILIPRLNEIGYHERVMPIQNANYLNTWLKAISAANNLPPITFHSLRHSFCSLAYSAGISEAVCQRLGGWASPATIHSTYLHLSKNDLHRQTEKLAELCSHL